MSNRSLSSRAVTRKIARRTVLVGAAALPLARASAVDAAPVESFDPTDRRILQAYSNWLHFERLTLCAEMYPDFPDGWQIVPASTGIDTFHLAYLSDETRPEYAGPNEAPSSRAARVLRTAGANLDQVVRRSIW